MHYDKTRLRALAVALPGRVGALALAGAERAAEDARASMRVGGTSVAGGPPSVRTGTLRASLRPHPSAPTKGTYAARVFSDAPHAPFVEFGTATLAARPFLWPALLRLAVGWANVVREEALLDG